MESKAKVEGRSVRIPNLAEKTSACQVPLVTLPGSLSAPSARSWPDDPHRTSSTENALPRERFGGRGRWQSGDNCLGLPFPLSIEWNKNTLPARPSNPIASLRADGSGRTGGKRERPAYKHGGSLALVLRTGATPRQPHFPRLPRFPSLRAPAYSGQALTLLYAMEKG